MRRPGFASLSFVVAGIAAGCGGSSSGVRDGGSDAAADGSGGGDGGDAAPDTGNPGVAIPGGGTSGGAIDGVLNVHVLDGETDKPVAGAFLQIGATAAGALTGTSDATGLHVFAAAGLKGPLVLTAGKTGYRTATFVDLDASTVTVALDPVKPTPIDTGRIHGVVDLSGLPALPSGVYRAAYVLYQLTEDFSAPRNNLVQDHTTILPGITDNVYAPDVLGRTEFTLVAPAGALDLYAIIGEVDTKGSLNPDDFTYALTHIGVLDGLTLAKGEDKTGVMIARAAPLDQSLRVTPPPPPAGLTGTIAYAVLYRGPGKLCPISFPGLDYMAGIPGPKLEGAFAGASLWVVAGADNYDATVMQPPALPASSTSITRGITSYAATIMPGAFLPLVAAPAWASDAVSYGPVTAASVHVFDIAPQGKDILWTVTVFDPTRSKLSLPDLPSGVEVETLPSGALDLAARAITVSGFDARHATFRAAAAAVDRTSVFNFAGTR